MIILLRLKMIGCVGKNCYSFLIIIFLIDRSSTPKYRLVGVILDLDPGTIGHLTRLPLPIYTANLPPSLSN